MFFCSFIFSFFSFSIFLDLFSFTSFLGSVFFLVVFLFGFSLTDSFFDSSFLKDSKMANYILDNTLVLSNVSNEITDIYGDVYDIIDNRKDKSNEEMNEEILKVLIDKKVVTKESAKKLVERNKVHINDMSIVE